ncbi:hydroxyethylthiazole kinase [Microbaculum marinisediminis]|uniref:Hydroxyethylthiazole kinase n=1 Tax=Microbaculum marinisediminis TaxID=2931392 RepID=A0AAW5R531_9HYPH|nr:hydroxyethylthiazole kinase [Microbaculum sp. A6E488]MCT8974889.1 hydroxyethylthiazole kinase [Microbaculum sp. A6E488]
MTAFTIDPNDVVGAVARLRARRPRVHCITNAAAVTLTANVLLAAGAVPSMTVNPEEVPDFVAGADALLVNLGTLDPQRQAAIDAAVEVATEAGTPWVLDPVFVERSPVRLALARRLAAAEPTVIRLNRPELAALTGTGGHETAGDATAADDASADAYALSSLSTVARTGDVDYVTEGGRAVRVAGGHPLTTLVTATGCATGALMAGFLAVEHDAVVAAAACLAFVSAAAERAGAEAAGPGTFSPLFIDALNRLSPEDIGASTRIS